MWKFLIKLLTNLSQKSPQTDHFLREGRLLTPDMDSMCGGLNLKVGKLYLIAGNSQHINICNYVKEYSQMSIVERRGFAGGYKKGCACEVSEAYIIIVAPIRVVLTQIGLTTFADCFRLSQRSKWSIIKRLASANGHRFPIVKPILELAFQRAAISLPMGNQSNAIGATVNRTIRVSAKPNRIDSSNSFKLFLKYLAI